MNPIFLGFDLYLFLQFLRRRLLDEIRGNASAGEVEINFYLLRGLTASFPVAFMYKDFLDKLIEHGVGERVEGLALVDQRKKFSYQKRRRQIACSISINVNC